MVFNEHFNITGSPMPNLTDITRKAGFKNNC